MISIAKIRGGGAAQADYYLDRDSGCEHAHDLQAGYYVDGPESAGRWVGNGAEALGLTGELGEDGKRQFRELLAGRFSGEQLAKPVLRYPDGKAIDIRVSGYDLTVSAPKSVSTLMAVASPEVARVIVAAHGKASGEAMLLLEQLSARAARGHHGDGQRAPRIATDGFIGAGFTHATSRALDPQLHTHLVVMNLIRGEDGRWSAVDSRTLHKQATAASYLYQHLLRAELTRELGVAWEPVEKGVAEITGVPKSVRREFSTRRNQIDTLLAATGPAETARRRVKTLAAKAACLATRPVKVKVAAATLRQDWARRAAAKGFSPEQAAALLGEQHRPDPLDRREIEARVLSGAGVTRERPTFDQGTVLKELIAALPPGTPLDRAQLLTWTSRLMQHEDVVEIRTDDLHTYTTRDMLQVEHEVLSLANQTDRRLAVVPGALRALTLSRRTMREEQRDLAHVLLSSGRPVEIVSGPAGSGKTHGLAAAREAWTSAGIAVQGTAVAALTAQGLQDATGAPSVSLTRLLHQPERHLPHSGVLLVDEAGMIGTRQLHRLLTLAAQRDCKVVLAGDPAQLPELDAGGGFAALTQQPHALLLHGHGRQTQWWEQHALQDLRAGRTTAALEAYDEHSRLHVHHTRDDVRAHAVQHYLTARSSQTDPWNVAVLATSRSDVVALNARIRKELLAAGVLSKRTLRSETPDGTREYRQGDQVLITRNHHDRDLLNGTRGTVRTVRRDGLVVDLTSGRSVILDKTWLAHGDLDHGYAMTLHKAQGRTVHTSIVIGDESLSREAGYVGLSRGTHANHLYLDADSETALRDADCSSLPEPRSLPTSLTSRSARALTRSTQQQLALTQRREGHSR